MILIIMLIQKIHCSDDNQVWEYNSEWTSGTIGTDYLPSELVWHSQGIFLDFFALYPFET